MRSCLPRALFVLAVLAGVLLGLPLRAVAHEGSPDRPMIEARHGAGLPAELCAMDGERLSTADSPASTHDGHCHSGVGSPALLDSACADLLVWTVGLVHALPAADQGLVSGTVLPPLRPPRA